MVHGPHPTETTVVSWTGDAPTGGPPAGAQARGEDPAAPSQPPGARRGDRWRWRARLRAERPHLYGLYRAGVGVVGVLLLLASAATGWLPGPGGIPLAVLGLVVLASEYPWAQRLLAWTRARLRDLGAWNARQPAWVRALGVVVSTVTGLVAVALMLGALLGIPSWVPAVVSGPLDALPGLHPRG